MLNKVKFGTLKSVLARLEKNINKRDIVFPTGPIIGCSECHEDSVLPYKELGYLPRLQIEMRFLRCLQKIPTRFDCRTENSISSTLVLKMNGEKCSQKHELKLGREGGEELCWASSKEHRFLSVSPEFNNKSPRL